MISNIATHDEISLASVAGTLTVVFLRKFSPTVITHSHHLSLPIIPKSLYTKTMACTATYDHRLRRTGHPVRSAIHKPQIGRLVVGWVTTSEYLLLYVFAFACIIAVFFNTRYNRGILFG
jgi:hypothetical protein